jgi:cobaltochelatase CobN
MSRNKPQEHNRMKFNKWKWVLVCLLLLLPGWFLYARYLGPTRIALVNFPDFAYAPFLEVNDNPFVRIERVWLKEEESTNLNGYSVMYLFGKGTPVTEAGGRSIREAMAKGVKIHSSAHANAESYFSNLADENREMVEGYFANGGRENTRRLLNFSRRVLDRKVLFSETVREPLAIPNDLFFHLGDELFFETFVEYQNFYAEKGLYKENAPKVALVTTNMGPRNSDRNHVDMLIGELEKAGLNVYPISGSGKRLQFLKEIEPSLVFLLPHGRFVRDQVEEGVAWLRERNIPLLCPISVYHPHDEWIRDQRGMEGGMLSSFIVLPEVDGGTTPYVYGAQFTNKQGLYVFGGIPGRVEKLVQLAKKWLALQEKPNAEKKVAIYYYKGPGQNAMVASGMEVAPSLLNLLRHLKANGYETGELPKDENELIERIQKEGPVLGAYAKGTIQEFLDKGNPELVDVGTYLDWCRQDLEPEMYDDIVKNYGEAPGEYLSVRKGDKSYIAVGRVRFGNVVLLPQPLPAYGENEIELIHGAKKAPPHPYAASYLWAKNGFGCDVIMHFGTHGSLEFTPWKQVGLSEHDWPDALVGGLPHLYLYIVHNVGEGIAAKRRSYATLVSYITPPYTGSDLYGELHALHDKMHGYLGTSDEALQAAYLESIKKMVLAAGLHKDLGLDGLEKQALTRDMFDRIHNHLHVLEQEKITKGLYVLGEPYANEEVLTTARLMAIDPLSFSMAKLDRLAGKVTQEQLDDLHYFEDVYRMKASEMIDRILHKEATPDDYLTPADRQSLERWDENRSADGGENLAQLPEKEKERIAAIRTYRDTLLSVGRYAEAVAGSSAAELQSLINGLNGGYISPSPGGEPVFNPEAVPTGRNLYAIDVEKTPTEEAMVLGKGFAEKLIAARLAATGQYPRKIAFTLWAFELVRDQGTTLAEIFYLLGVEPVKDSRGVVHDVRLIPAEQLQRPRIDVVVQTSGLFRDVATSRIYLINKAVKLASEARETEEYKNYVREGTQKAEEVMKEKGLSPLEARKFAVARVFGELNGGYGSGINELVEAGDKWETEEEISDTYLKNMGAVYTKENWAHYQEGIFTAALQDTEVVIHPRSLNGWGPLSIDDIYEYMGGINAAIRRVTGKDPEGYFNDLRNKQNPKVQDVKEAIWVEARTTVFNPKYINGLKEGGASSAEQFAEAFRNVYGWNVMKPKAIDKEIWESLYRIYVQDEYRLDLEKFFRDKNPYALQEMTAVMLETIRKGYWQADEATIKAIADLHVRLVRDHQAGCSGFVCDNAKLRQMIAGAVSPELKEVYQKEIAAVRTGKALENKEGMKLKKEEITLKKVKEMMADNLSAVVSMLLIVGIFSMAVIFGVIRRRN